MPTSDFPSNTTNVDTEATETIVTAETKAKSKLSRKAIILVSATAGLLLGGVLVALKNPDVPQIEGDDAPETPVVEAS